MPVFFDWIDQRLLPIFLSLDFIPSSGIHLLTYIGNIKIQLACLMGLFLITSLTKKDKTPIIAKLLFQLTTLFFFLYLLKITAIRIRPEFSHDSLLIESLWQRLFDNRFHSFPSSHAAVMGFWLAYKPKNLLVLSLTLLMGISRVSLNQHYPTDVLFGLLVGIVLYIYTDRLSCQFLGKKKASA